MSRLSGALGLFALTIVLVVLGLAYTAVKWLLVVAVVVFLLGVLRAWVSDRTSGRGSTGQDGQDGPDVGQPPG